MTALIRLAFLGLYRSYHAGDVAGFPAGEAERLIRAGVARLDGEEATALAVVLPVDPFDGLSRVELLAYGRDVFGVEEDPPEDATDDELREALRALAAENRDADFQEGSARLDHPTQGSQVDGVLSLQGAGTPNAVSRRATSKRLAIPVSPAGDQLDVLDRPHLEALAKVRLGVTEIDSDLTDDELREQIRVVSEAKAKG